MGTNYPGGLDSWDNPGPNDLEDNPSFYHDVMHGDVYDAIEAIETELGTNPSGTYSTVKDRIVALEAAMDRRNIYTAYGTPVFADEFTTDDGQWTIVYPTGKQANVSWAVSNHCVVANHAAITDGDGADMHAFLRPVPRTIQVGDAIQTAWSNIGPWGDYTMVGVGFSTGTTWGTSNDVMAQAYDDDNNFRINGNNGMNSDTVAGTGASISYWAPMPMHIRCVLVSTNTWRADRSYDGVNWMLGVNTSYTLGTPTHMGLFITNWTSSKAALVHYEYLRMYEGVS